ncbi:acyl carrier protein [Dongshaea marina]|uniref:acyl carrier protein n=1 Tax=Dongshaea marina TaxID=2047966 RepID=UPI000D3E11BE|nr:hypothetical protein [Dongshaea marina]
MYSNYGMNTVKEIVARCLHTRPELLNEDHHLIDDLYACPLDLQELKSELARRFKISEQSLSLHATLQELCHTLEQTTCR